MKCTAGWKKVLFLFGIIAFFAVFMVACNESSDHDSNPGYTAPAITSTNSTGFTEGSAGTFTVTATGNPAPTVALTGTLPSGVSFNTATGVLSGTPATGSDGTYPLTITASNGVSPDATQNFTLTVTGPPRWRTAARIDTNTGANDALEGQIASNGTGNFIAVWRQSVDSGPTEIWASTYDAATQTWSTAVMIESSTYYSQEPQVAMDSTGNAVAIWTQGAAVGNHMWANTYDAATETWGTAVQIETNASSSTRPQLSMNATGQAVCVWEEDYTNLWANRYDPVTKTWGTEVEIDDISDPALQPQVAVDGSGNAVVVFIQSVGGSYNIMANNYNAATHTWGTSVLIETEDLGIALNPQIGMDGTGDAVSIWQQFDGIRYNIWANTYSATTKTWGTAAKIETSDETTNYQQLAVNASGDAVAVWLFDDAVTGRNKAYANTYHKATGWGTATRIEADSTATSSNLRDPQVAIDASGNAVAVWTWYNVSIRANTYDAGTDTWGAAAQTVGTGLIDEFTLPQVAMDGSGRAMCIWARNTVQANIYR